jgi:hypothetical protein
LPSGRSVGQTVNEGQLSFLKRWNMDMTVTDLQYTLDQLLEQGIVKPDYIVAFTHRERGEILKCFPIDGEKTAVVDAYPGCPKMLVFTTDMDVKGDEQ